jgi:hypothetical protein
MAQRKRDREAEEASVIYDDPNSEAGNDCAAHRESQNATNHRKELGLMKAVASVKYDCRQEIDEEGLGVE